jgi:hypothetical protein
MRRALGQAQGKVASMEAQRQAAARAGKDVSKLDAQIAEERRQMENVSALAGGPDGHTTMKVGLHTGWPRLDRGIEKANANPALLFYKLQSSAYKYSWALIPISVPFLWLLFLHRRRYREQYKAYDHLVFVTYSIAFMTLAIVAIVLLRSTGFATGIAKLALFVVPPVHVYRQLRGAYRLGRLSALWRTAALLFFSGVALTVFLALLLVIGIMG